MAEHRDHGSSKFQWPQWGTLGGGERRGVVGWGVGMD